MKKIYLLLFFCLSFLSGFLYLSANDLDSDKNFVLKVKQEKVGNNYKYLIEAEKKNVDLDENLIYIKGVENENILRTDFLDYSCKYEKQGVFTDCDVITDNCNDEICEISIGLEFNSKVFFELNSTNSNILDYVALNGDFFIFKKNEPMDEKHLKSFMNIGESQPGNEVLPPPLDDNSGFPEEN